MAGSGDRFWILAAAYLTVGLEAGITSLLGRERKDRTFWAAISIMLLLFAAAKESHLQGLLTDWLRTSARQHHLYGSRAFAQDLFVLILMVGAIIAVNRLRHWLKASAWSIATAALAMTALVAFILVRAASIHALDGLSTTRIAGLRSGWWVEIAGLFVIALAAGAFLRDQGRSRRA